MFLPRRSLGGQPALAVARRLRLRPARGDGFGVLGGLFRARSVAAGDLVRDVVAVGPERLVLARAHREDDARAVARSDDHMLRLGRAVREVPLAQRPLLALDDQQRLAREHEESLRLGFPVVHGVRLARLEDGKLCRPWRWNQRASRAFTTNQPALTGTSPASVSWSLASGTTAGS